MSRSKRAIDEKQFMQVIKHHLFSMCYVVKSLFNPLYHLNNIISEDVPMGVGYVLQTNVKINNCYEPQHNLHIFASIDYPNVTRQLFVKRPNNYELHKPKLNQFISQLVLEFNQSHISNEQCHQQ